MLFLIAVLGGVLAGYAWLGRLKRLATLSMAEWWLIPLSLAIQLAGGAIAPERREVPIAIGYLLLVLWIVRVSMANPRRLQIAFLALGAGLVMNAAVIAANGGMPVSRAAIERAGLPIDFEVEGGFPFEHLPKTPDSKLGLLADVIPVRWPTPNVLSAGDLAMLAGISLLIALGMTNRVDADPDRMRR